MNTEAVEWNNENSSKHERIYKKMKEKVKDLGCQTKPYEESFSTRLKKWRREFKALRRSQKNMDI